MKILVAEDEIASRRMLEEMLKAMGHSPVPASDGEEALQKLKADDEIRIVILDWIMPRMAGLDVCKRIRSSRTDRYIYVIFVTVKTAREDILEGLNAGADDYICKPYDEAELAARIRSAVRLVDLQQQLEKKVQELQEAVDEIKALQRLIPICSYCKRVRTDKQFWEEVESYLHKHAGMMFTHSICPDCLKKHAAELGLSARDKKDEGND